MVSIVMPVYNDERYIADAVSALLNQAYSDFELILVNDASTDRTKEIINTFSDKRITTINNEQNVGIAKSRNIGINISKGKFIFCTDSDCITDRNWVAEGLKEFENDEVVGVEGRTIYHEEGYRPSFSDRLPGDLTCRGGQYMCCNVAYRAEIFRRLGGFDNRFAYHEDRNFALRARESGEIAYSDSMLVTHRKKVWSITGYVLSGKRAASKVLLYKYNLDTSEMTWKIMLFRDLLKVLCPPLILYTVINNDFHSWADLRLIPFIYFRHLYSRYMIWKQSVKERVLVL